MNLNLTQFAPDKLGHYVAGTIAALLGLLLALLPYLSAGMPAPCWALFTCLAAAVAREAYNHGIGSEADMADIGATMLGGAAVALAAALA